MTLTTTLLSALAAATHDMRDPVKNAKNPHFRSNYADLNSVLNCIREPLEKHGLLVLQCTQLSDATRVLATQIIHVESGESLECGGIELLLDKPTAQAQGSAITYARRYALQTIFGLSAVDDDGNAASGHERKPAARSASAQPAAKPTAQPDSDKPKPFFNTIDIEAAIEGCKTEGELSHILARMAATHTLKEPDKVPLRILYKAKLTLLKNKESA